MYNAPVCALEASPVQLDTMDHAATRLPLTDLLSRGLLLSPGPLEDTRERKAGSSVVDRACWRAAMVMDEVRGP